MINIITANDEQEYKKIQYNTHIVESIDCSLHCSIH